MSVQRPGEVAALALSPGVRYLLLDKGFDVDGLQGYTPLEVAMATGMVLEDAREAIEAAQQYTMQSDIGLQGVSALELYRHQNDSLSSMGHIITFNAELDKLLGGGVMCGQVTEFCGVPGVGKTQLGIQLAVDVQIPEAFGGAGGTAVYVDTEGSFMVGRAHEIAKAAVRHIHAAAQRPAMQAPGGQDVQAEAQRFTAEAVMTNIHMFRVHDIKEQLAVIITLSHFLREHPEVRLVVIDSVTFHFRQEMSDMGARGRTLMSMAQALMDLAEVYHVAVVLINQVTTRVMGESLSKLVPALGDSWGQAASTRVILHWQGSDRYATLVKSPCLPPGTAHYQVTSEGVRGQRRQRQNPSGRASGGPPSAAAVQQPGW